MITKTLISTYPSARAAYAGYEALSTSFLKTYKRAAQVELFMGPSVDGSLYELRAYSKPSQEEEVRWFLANAEGAK